MSIQRQLILLLICLLPGCGADQRGVPEIPRDLSTSKTQQGVTLDLTELELKSHEDFDRFEKRVLSKIPTKQAIEIYEALADKNRIGKAREDALLLSRRFVFMFRSTGQTSDEAERKSLIERAQKIRVELRENYPNDPHTLFTEGYFSLQIFQVYGLQVRARASKLLGEDIRTQSVRELKTAWGELLRLEPDYVGCDGFDAARIRRELAKLDEAPITAEVDRRSAGSTQPVASQNLALARESLWGIENKPQQTASICRDYQKAITGKEGLALPASFAEADIGLTCGVSLGNRELAILGLGQLILRGPRTDVCHDLETIRCRTQSRACTRFKEIIGTAGDAKQNLCVVTGLFAAQTLIVARSLNLSNSSATDGNKVEPQDIDVVEGNQRLRRLEGGNGVILAQAVGRRANEIDGFPRTKKSELALNEAMASDSARKTWVSLTSLLLGREDALNSSSTKTTFDGVTGYLLQLEELGTNIPNRTLDVSFFLTRQNPENRWVTSAISIFSNSGEREKLKLWSEPRFPANAPVKAKPVETGNSETDPAVPNSDVKPGPNAPPKKKAKTLLDKEATPPPTVESKTQ